MRCIASLSTCSFADKVCAVVYTCTAFLLVVCLFHLSCGTTAKDSLHPTSYQLQSHSVTLFLTRRRHPSLYYARQLLLMLVVARCYARWRQAHLKCCDGRFMCRLRDFHPSARLLSYFLITDVVQRCCYTSAGFYKAVLSHFESPIVFYRGNLPIE